MDVAVESAVFVALLKMSMDLVQKFQRGVTFQ